MSYSSDVKEKRKLGVPMRRSDGCARIASCIAYDVSKMALAYLRYPSRPRLTIAAQVAANSPPERDPSIPGEQYFPPDQSVR